MIYTSISPDDIAFGEHQGWVDFANDGSAIASKLLMNDAAILIQHGLVLPEPLASYIGKALYISSLIKNSVDVDIAFNLKLKSTHDKHSKSFEYRMICFAVELAHRRGLTYEDAYLTVGEQFDKHSDSVRRIRRNHKNDWDIASKSDHELQENVEGIMELLSKT